MKMTLSEVIPLLKRGGIGVLPTDTLYGVVALALNPEAVERVYRVKGRAPSKPCIILIGEVRDLDLFGVVTDDRARTMLDRLWPGAVSVVLQCPKSEFEYLHRGTGTLAFRLPADEELRELLRGTGPLIAPSANPEGKAPAKTIDEAKMYFGGAVDFYEDGGELRGEPSTLIEMRDGGVFVLRRGSATIPKEFL